MVNHFEKLDHKDDSIRIDLCGCPCHDTTKDRWSSCESCKAIGCRTFTLDNFMIDLEESITKDLGL